MLERQIALRSARRTCPSNSVSCTPALLQTNLTRIAVLAFETMKRMMVDELKHMATWAGWLEMYCGMRLVGQAD